VGKGPFLNIWGGGGMNFQEKTGNTLIDLAEVVHTNPIIEELCQFLAIHICPSGELARVYVGRLDKDGVIRTASSFGYSTDVNVDQIETAISMSRPMPDAMRRGDVVIGNRETILKNYESYEPLDSKSPWLSTAVVPTFCNYIFVFRLQCRIKDLPSMEMYFRAVRAILSFYDFEQSISRVRHVALARLNRQTGLTESLYGQALTDRQISILESIKERKTNIAIANLLGYSESLIRQETMIIYAKLGVDGRREILAS
jgi:DNA-binding CsgD family transcriptional regulator